MELITTIFGFAIVLGGWVLLQNFIRRHSGCAADKDLLDHMPHGCAGCSGSGDCRKRRDEHHHELA